MITIIPVRMIAVCESCNRKYNGMESQAVLEPPLLAVTITSPDIDATWSARLCRSCLALLAQRADKALDGRFTPPLIGERPLYDVLRFTLLYLRQAHGATELPLDGVSIIPMTELPKFESTHLTIEVSSGEAPQVWIYVIGEPEFGPIGTDRRPILLCLRRERPGRNWPALVIELAAQYQVDYIVAEANMLYALRLLGLEDRHMHTFETWLEARQRR